MNDKLLINLTNIGLLTITGQDAASFLQGMLTTDIRALVPNGHQLTAFCNRQGRVLALMNIFRIKDDYYLTVPMATIHEIKSTLEKYIVFSKATITDVSNHYKGIALLNPPAELPNDLIHFKSTPKAKALQVWGDQKTIESYCKTADFRMGNWEDFLQNEEAADIPYIGAAESGQFLPHPLGLVKLGVIDFKKGCYIGQEIIARMEYRSRQYKNAPLKKEGDA